MPVLQFPLKETVSIALQRLPHGMNLPLPGYGTPLSAGLDLYAAVEESLTLAPREWQPVPTGIAIAIPQGYEGQIRPRSGLAAKYGITILNAPGTIDADHRGELKGLLINHGEEPFIINRGMRFAQLVIAPVASIVWDEQALLTQTERGHGGFGSTGIS